MKESGKKNASRNSQTKNSRRTEKRDNKLHHDNHGKTSNVKETDSKTSLARPTTTLLSDSNTGSEPSETYEDMVIHYVDDVNRSEGATVEMKVNEMVTKNGVLNDQSSDLEKEQREGNEEVSDAATIKDSVSSQGDSSVVEDEKVGRASSEPKIEAKVNPSEGSRGSRERSDRTKNKPLTKESHNNQKKPMNSNGGPSTKTSSLANSKAVKVPAKPLSESSDVIDENPGRAVKELDVLDGGSNGAQSVGSEDESHDAKENGEHEDEADLELKIEEMEARVEMLEEELREVAALEISLYSVVPEHGSSAHKVHTPARRLSRLYIHACKHFTQAKRATIAKNTVSGLVLVAKSCGSDVSRLTFWLSNTIVLREIILQAFGSSCQSSTFLKLAESNGNGKRNDGKSPALKWKGISNCEQVNGFMHPFEDWQETGTFTSALEKVESWVFSRIVESVWWQALTPYMQSSARDSSSNKSLGKLLGPALGDQKQGSFSINLWRNAFQDAFQRLCPVRAGGHECGCLPVLARMVMEQCIARLDVAMFNAILRESAHEIPTDPVSDPIVDSKVLPIPAGDLSFGSGAQLKNSIGNWSRWLTDKFGMDAEDCVREDENNKDDDTLGGDGEPKSFVLLNALSDLLMLPKDMLMDTQVRQEVCPSISLSLVKRILCNFTPDDFCPDPVPGAVLETLNAESVVERRMSGDSVRSFPYAAAPVVYSPPSSANVAEKVAVAGGKTELARNVSAVKRRGYTSDDELEELDCPLISIIDKLPPSPTVTANGDGNHKEQTSTNARYELLREVWSS
ncbi:hypothetical protein L6164_009419 [Bauhinia variegata]|uniref:Uncharacterized protein n=1 Tax=Bauhinia variegata TaxID=167791 RepID=A0ACB9PIV8_BAUVA|nr:hypothetical protein L6164_009419 [Bauhinia variegata]